MNLLELNSIFGKYKGLIPITLLILAVIIVWGKSVCYEFVWDDAYYIVENEALRDPGRIKDFFISAEAQKSAGPYPYRSLRTLHFAMLTWITGEPSPRLFHTVNLIWHSMVSVLFYLLILKVLRFTCVTSPV